MLQKLKKNIVHLIFSFINQKKILCLVKKSKKYQKLLEIQIDDYLIYYTVKNYYTKYDTPLNIELDNQKITSKIGKSTKTHLQIKNKVFEAQINYFNLYPQIINHKILFAQKEYNISSTFLSKNSSYIVFGTKNGTMVMFDISSNELKFEFKPHKSTITKIIELKYDQDTFHLASSSVDSVINVYSIQLYQIKIEFSINIGRPAFSLCEVRNHSIAVASKEIIIIDLHDHSKFNRVLNHYGTTRSLLPLKNGDIIIAGSSKVEILPIKPVNKYIKLIQNDEINKSDNIYYTNQAFCIREIAYINDKYFCIAEDDHLKLCWFEKKNKSIIIKGIPEVNILSFKQISEKEIISSGEDGSVIIWDIELYCIQAIIFTEHIGPSTSIEIDLYGNVYSFGTDGKIIVMNVLLNTLFEKDCKYKGNVERFYLNEEGVLSKNLFFVQFNEKNPNGYYEVDD